MTLTNEQYAAIRRHYDSLQMNHLFEQNRRYEEVSQKIPEIPQLDRNLASQATRLCQEGLAGNELASAEMKEIAENTREKRIQLLIAHGYPKDYLDPIFSCRRCEDTGRLAGGLHCTCFQKAVTDLFYADTNQKNRTEQENFNTFRMDYYDDTIKDPKSKLTDFENIQIVVSEIRKFINQFDSDYQNLLLYGTSGVGKTFLANCIYKELFSTHSVIYLTAYELFTELEQIKFRRDDADGMLGRNGMDALLDCDLLIIDDLGSELGNSFTTSQLFNIINERQLKKRSVVISTNLSVSDLTNRYGERIFSRILSSYELLRIQGADIRIKKQS